MLHFVSGFVKAMRDSKFVKNSFQVRKFIAIVDSLIYFYGWYIAKEKPRTKKQSFQFDE